MIMLGRPRLKDSDKGFTVPLLIGMIVGFSILLVVVSQIITSTLGSATIVQRKQEALNIAEAGLNYYLWHLSHNPNDYRDGNSTGGTDAEGFYGPYEHVYYDGSGVNRGKYILRIKPGANGANTTTVQSEGVSNGIFPVSRKVRAVIGAPSFAVYALATNAEVWFGNTEKADGAVHSNTGVKMDGPNTSDVTANNKEYVPSPESGPGSGTRRPGVWCYSGVLNPNCNNRSKTSWRAPAPRVDFTSLTADMCNLKRTSIGNQAFNCSTTTSRNDNHGYIPRYDTSENRGYLITLKNNGKYRLDRVTNENDRLSPYTYALTTTLVKQDIPIPADKVLYVEDDVWIRTEPGGFNGRVTIVAADLVTTSNKPTITIVDNLKYADKYSGANAIGLIAANNVEIAPYVPAPVEVNGALIAQKGKVTWRLQHRSNGNVTRGYSSPGENFTFYGSVASFGRWTWSYILCSNENSNSCWSGFRHTTTTYDEALRYNPPPNFPVTSTYDILDWREILTDP